MASHAHAADSHPATVEEFEDSGIPQPYHLVKPSPWPLLGAFAAGLMFFGMVVGMHPRSFGLDTWVGYWPMLPGGLGVLAVMYFWWRDIVRESVKTREHTPIVKIGLRYGVTLFIASEVMFFVAFFWAFFANAVFPPVSNEVRVEDGSTAIEFTARTDRAFEYGQWPPEGIEAIDPFRLPALMTLILLLSGTTVTWAHHEILRGRRSQALKALGITVLLGILFTFVQLFEYSHARFSITSTNYGGAFYMATGFHGFHVLIGTIFLAVCWFRLRSGHFSPRSHFGFEAAAWYWHFVDVVWLFLFTAIYWWGGRG